MYSNDTDLTAYTYDEEAIITEMSAPLVIDAGSRFIDDDDNQHENACGWLAVHAALHFAFANKRLPTDLTDQLKKTELTPDKLKLKSGCYSLNTRITDSQIEAICRVLKIKIIVHEKGQPYEFGQNRRFTIQLWLSQFHYTVLISKKGEDDKFSLQAAKFVSKFMNFGYELKTLRPINDELKSYQAALRLHRELNENQIDTDGKYALWLQEQLNKSEPSHPEETLLQSYQRLFG